METQQGFTLWLTGMSGAGKSALASYLVGRLPLVGRRVELLDASELGDLAPDAPHTGREERDRTVRLLGWVAKLLTRNGTIPVVAAISPHREVRDDQRRQIGRFFEVMVECPFEILMERDTNGIYRRALAGEIEDVVGVQTPYEPPQQPEAVVDMARGDVEAAAAEIFEKLASHGYLTRQERDVLVNGSAQSDAPAKTKASKPGKGRSATTAPVTKGKADPAKKAKPAAKGSKTLVSAAAASKAKSPAKAAQPSGKSATKAASAKAKVPSKAAPKAKAPGKAAKVAPKAKAPAKVAKPAPKKAVSAKASSAKASSAKAKAKAPARMAAGKVRAAR